MQEKYILYIILTIFTLRVIFELCGVSKIKIIGNPHHHYHHNQTCFKCWYDLNSLNELASIRLLFWHDFMAGYLS